MKRRSGTFATLQHNGEFANNLEIAFYLKLGLSALGKKKTLPIFCSKTSLVCPIQEQKVCGRGVLRHNHLQEKMRRHDVTTALQFLIIRDPTCSTFLEVGPLEENAIGALKKSHVNSLLNLYCD